MYRFLVLLLLCVNAVIPAPQNKPDSDVTFVKIQPVLEDTAPETTVKRRESRIENLPLTIPGNLDKISPETDRSPDETDKSPSEADKNSGETVKLTDGDLTDLSKQSTELSEQRTELSKESTNLSKESTQLSKESTDLSKEGTELTEQGTGPDENFNSDIIPLGTSQTRQGRTYDSDETTESFEIATDKYEDVISSKPPFVPKLSYFQKPVTRYSNNLIDKSGLRKFRSRCRCEKIWNCPKLQISVPRCPNEYFLCCF